MMTKDCGEDDKNDLVIVGGGLAGLAAAVAAAGAGLRVSLLEKAGTTGGRAQTQKRDGFCFNVGPHALYRGLAGMRVLRSFGIEPRGGIPSVTGAFAIHGGDKHALPGGLRSLLGTSLFGIGAKLELAVQHHLRPKTAPA
ncbi:MAG: FAD-dependent oxidoreductase [Deltaproteobacteria bacterium]